MALSLHLRSYRHQEVFSKTSAFVSPAYGKALASFYSRILEALWWQIFHASFQGYH
jgi:hypothetical protein